MSNEGHATAHLKCGVGENGVYGEWMEEELSPFNLHQTRNVGLAEIRDVAADAR